MRVSGNIVDVLNKEIFPGTIEFRDGIIASIVKERHRYETYILPGFIDAHCHIESSMLCPSEFARIASTHGTVATISDPHEIANVLGIDGVYFMMENGKQVPFNFYFGAPSCVPATPFETSGASIDIEAIEMLLKNPQIKYLGEMMNFPGVINNDPLVMNKIVIAKKYNKPVDGHAPGLSEEALRKYIDAGITTDHETFTYEEGEEKISLGMKLIIREGSAAKNFDTLSPLIEKYPDSCMLCSDDKHPDDLTRGHINSIVKKAIFLGIDPMKVLKSACINPVFHYNLDIGLLRIQDWADFIEVDDLVNLNIIKVYIKGEIVTENRASKISSIKPDYVNRFEAKPKMPYDFALPGNNKRIANIIEAINDQIITGWIKLPLNPEKGFFRTDIEKDILKIALICRYADKPPVVAFVKNFGLKKGAIASSVSHDSHNIVAVGTNDEDLSRAVNLIIENKGGLAIAAADTEEVLPLPVAGLMADGDGYRIGERYSIIDSLTKKFGSNLYSPFMTLSFMALPVIPRLKLTGKGLFNVDESRFIDVFE
ncbi:MAG: adenine deaminase [Syntrophorhabdales bacterium]|nr:adenine deaminase [Syntrophorhabdales bacterium]